MRSAGMSRKLDVSFVVPPRVDAALLGVRGKFQEKQEIISSRDSDTGSGANPTGPRPTLGTGYAETLEREGWARGGPLAFRLDWLQQRGMTPSESILLDVRGKSMEPTLPNRSSVLIDCTRRTRRDGGVFAVRTGVDIVLRRAGKDADGRWQLVSDDPGWPDALWPDSAEIIGEVRWVGTKLS